MQKRTIGLAATVAAAALVAAACSSSKSGGGSSGSASGGASGGRGPITFVTGKDTSGEWPPIAQAWNASHPNEKVTVKQQTDQADQQHDDIVQHFQAKDPGYDVVTADVIWTAEWAAKNWLVPLKGNFALDTSNMLAGPVKASTYNGTLYVAPFASDGALFYYRKDLVPTPPTTWSQLIADCPKKTSGMACYGGQFSKYEGLTCNAVESIYGAGGTVVKADGKTPDVDTAAAANGLNFLVNGFKQGYIAKEAITYIEESSRTAFQHGKLLFLRNWTYNYAHFTKDADSVVKGKFGVAQIPGLNGPGTSTLGGHGAAISVYSKHQATAYDFLKFIETPDMQANVFLKIGTNAPIIKAPYTDPALLAQFPYLPTLEKSIDTAIPRPVSPFYPKITESIETNVYQALQGTISTEAALKNIQAGITQAAGG